jgi:hypothetical protein
MKIRLSEYVDFLLLLACSNPLEVTVQIFVLGLCASMFTVQFLAATWSNIFCFSPVEDIGP